MLSGILSKEAGMIAKKLGTGAAIGAGARLGYNMLTGDSGGYMGWAALGAGVAGFKAGGANLSRLGKELGTALAGSKTLSAFDKMASSAGASARNVAAQALRSNVGGVRGNKALVGLISRSARGAHTGAAIAGAAVGVAANAAYNMATGDSGGYFKSAILGGVAGAGFNKFMKPRMAELAANKAAVDTAAAKAAAKVKSGPRMSANRIRKIQNDPRVMRSQQGRR